jgi:hypothetical protein
MAQFNIEKKNRFTGTWEKWGHLQCSTVREAKDEFVSSVGRKGGQFRLLDPNDKVIDLWG